MSLSHKQVVKLNKAIDKMFGLDPTSPNGSHRAIAEFRKRVIQTLSPEQIEALIA